MKDFAIFGGGCFWCTEAIFKNLKGVSSVTPGYSGGTIENPSYSQVSSGNTGHAEVVRIQFDPSIIPFKALVEVFMYTHDPSSLNRQGNDIGTQYRSVIFYTDEKQREVAQQVIDELRKEKPVVTELTQFSAFYEAEDYHKNYYENNENQPYCQVVISPKLQKLRSKYSKLLN